MNIKIYDIHGSSAVANAETLLTQDRKYFFWDDRRFRRFVLNDVVFWVNRKTKEAYMTVIREKDIVPETGNGVNTINWHGYKVTASVKAGQNFEKFVCFELVSEVNIPDGWEYADPGAFSSQGMEFILYQPGVSNPEKRIEKIEDLKRLFDGDAKAMEILDEGLKLLGGKVVEPPDRPERKVNEPVKNPPPSNSTRSILFSIIKTKPFVLLAGISGTGKTRLVKELAYHFCPPQLQSLHTPGNYQLIKVKPNWHDSSDLIGYESRINKPQYIVTDFIRFIVKAWHYPETPFFLCLDEMNLAPVEQYFAEYLSILETRFMKDGKLRSESFVSASVFNKYDREGIWDELEVKNNDIKNQFKEIGLTMPGNLIVMGTVNMDETTFSFSRKVLDRAMSLEINNIDLSLGLDKSADIWNYLPTPFDPSLVIPEFTHGYQVADMIGNFKNQIIGYLNEINGKLENTPFKVAYRVRDEFLIFAYNCSKENPDSTLDTILDEMTLIKILPRIEGDEDKTDVLEGLIEVFDRHKLVRSEAKADLMNRLRAANHYTSFWT